MDRRRFIATLPAAMLSLGAGSFFSAALAQSADDVDTSGIEDMALGDANASVKVIEYASFTCPHCANFHKTVFGKLKADYIDTGKIHFIHREVYFDRFGLWAAMVARCGGPERYFGIADMIYERQREWLSGEDASQIVGNLRKLGKIAGIGDAELDACLSDQQHAEALVARYQETAKADDITSTPSFVINGDKFSNMSYEDFSSVLDDKLGS
ncbi:thiol-disulfide oxidoreductase [Maritimibacter sp. 55A14]|uniref:DsbA family protein n=1 Tax=Maritimibacter sp. 55A14 TaxID=2174844 RepID=UPI000D60AA90|nr:DsbA family protein [Maritimibacter sp. 55A14]PWE32632.1 thiol-disulfide oxidoreductase [Maritimibacter sp. 55A14]